MAIRVPETEIAPDELQGRVVLVTGASAGIGRAVALSLAGHGALPILLGRTQRRLEALYDEIVAIDAAEPAICPFDLEKATWHDFLSIAAGIETDFGRLDGLLHNAAILGDRSPIEHYDVKTWDRTMRVNLTAPFMLTRACLPLLRASRDASVLFTSSGVGHRGRAYWGAYAASKAAVENLAETLADETEVNTQIRVNTINPGPVRTNMRLKAYPAEDRDALARPEEITRPYLYLLGPASKGVSGRHFDIQ